MSDFENANLPVSASPQIRTWDFMETTFVTLIAYGVFALTGGLALGVMLVMQDGADALSPSQLHELAMQGRWHGAALIIAAPPTIAVLWLAIRVARREFAEYLALNWPSRRELVRALGIAAILFVAELVFWSRAGVEASAADPLLSVRGAGGLLALLVGGCIAGPVVEEFVVRGFMFRGWSQSFLGPMGTVIVTSALWAMNHTQYDWFGRLFIFFVGLVLGHIRWRSNSTWLTVVVHSTLNIFLFFTMGPYT